MLPPDGLPLDGCHVLELAIWRPAPYAGQLLQELGAEILKVEPPGGDPMRTYPRLFAQVGAGKRSVVLDLKSEAGRARAHELAADADVVLEGYRPGVAARLGVGPEQLLARRPALVYVSVSGFGATGPLVTAPGHDVNYAAWAAALSPRDGGEPRDLPLPIADLAAGMAAALAAVAGWTRALRTGVGAFVDVAMTDVLATWAGLPGVNAVAGAGPGGEGGGGAGAPVTGMCAYGVFAVADGHVALGITTEDPFWDSLCGALGLTDVIGVPFLERLTRGDELRCRLVEALAGAGRDQLVATLLAVDVPIAPIQSHAEMARTEHLRSRGTVLEDAAGGLSFGPLLRFAGARTGPPPPPPALDEHRGHGFSTHGFS